MFTVSEHFETVVIRGHAESCLGTMPLGIRDLETLSLPWLI